MREYWDEGDMIAGPPIRVYTPFGCAWRVALAVLILYVLIIGVMLLDHA